MTHLGGLHLHLDEEVLGKRHLGVLYSLLEEEVLGTWFPGFLCYQAPCGLVFAFGGTSCDVGRAWEQTACGFGKKFWAGGT
jgi:hypothetical protein